MMNDRFAALFDVINARRASPQEGSYTCYLFDQGLDKMLKKLGEEAAETIIAAKNGEPEPLIGEICDLFYHLLVIMAEKGITTEDIARELEVRAAKIGNLKHIKDVERQS